jgi:tetratricopeptide (TPR) repeat protein
MQIESTIPACGASGAISALMGAFFVRFWSTKIRVLVCPFWIVPLAEAWVPAWAILTFWFYRDIVHVPLELAGDDFVGHTAHISGFVFGALFAGLLWRTGAEKKWLAPAVRARSEHTVIRNEEVNRALAAVSDERYAEAWDVLRERLERAPADEDAALALWFVGLEIERAHEAAPVLARVIEEEARRGQLDVAMEHLDELWAHVPDAPIDASCLIRLAGDLDRRRRRGEAIELLHRLIQSEGNEVPTDTVLRAAVVTVRFDPELAAVAARKALERSDLDLDGRAAAERILDLAARSTVPVSAPMPDPR